MLLCSYPQLAVTLFLALVVGAIFFDVKNDQSGVQNRSASSKPLLPKE